MNSQNWLATSPRVGRSEVTPHSSNFHGKRGKIRGAESQVGGSEMTAAQFRFSWQKGQDTRRRAEGQGGSILEYVTDLDEHRNEADTDRNAFYPNSTIVIPAPPKSSRWSW